MHDTLLPKQEAFVNSESREVLYSGAFAAGKTRAICFKVVKRASVPGACEGLCRKELVQLKATTLRTLLEPEGDLPPVLAPGTYTHNKTDKIIDLAPSGGGKIQYFGVIDEQKVRSMNLSGCGVDEASGLIEKDWTTLRGRIRLSVKGLKNQLYGATNPGSPLHFLAMRFGLQAGMDPRPGCEVIQTKTSDNPHLPEEYVEDMSTMTGVDYKRFYLGLWAGADGLVYDRFDPEIHVKRMEGPWKRCVIGVDDGYNHPFVALVAMVDGDGRIHIAHEAYFSKLLMKQKRALILAMQDGSIWEDEEEEDRPDVRVEDHKGPGVEIEVVVVDPSAAALKAELMDGELYVLDADNAREDGVARVQQRLSLEGDGLPRLTISPRCASLLREFESYEFLPESDQPEKRHDDALDALRYLVAYVNASDGASEVAFV